MQPQSPTGNDRSRQQSRPVKSQSGAAQEGGLTSGHCATASFCFTRYQRAEIRVFLY